MTEKEKNILQQELWTLVAQDAEATTHCFKISLKSKTPIVPVVLIDSYRVYNTCHVGNIKTQVHFLKPIMFEEYKDMNTKEIADMVKAKIQEKINEVTKTCEA